MKKSEMEWHFSRLRESSTSIEAMLRQRPIDLCVFDRCVESFDHIIPALRHWAKERPDSEIVSVVPYCAIDLYGPPFFAHEAIVAMCEHVNANRYLKKAAFPFSGMTATLHRRERDAVTLWNWIEHNPGGDQVALWRDTTVENTSGLSTVNQWVEHGVVHRISDGRLFLATDLSAPVFGMCPNCGVTGTGRRELLYKSRICQKCGVQVFYHLVQA